MIDEPHDPILVPGSNPDPASPNHAPVKSAVHARSGVTFGTMRWVLAISMVAVGVVFALVWIASRH